MKIPITKLRHLEASPKRLARLPIERTVWLFVVLCFLTKLSLPLLGEETLPNQFERDVRPILEQHCFSCHDLESHQSNLVLNTVEAIRQGGALDGPGIIPGNSDESPLILRLLGKKKPLMPIGSEPLGHAEINLISEWIDQMPAVLETKTVKQPSKIWPWTPLKQPQAPIVSNRNGQVNPIDSFILAKLEQKGLKLAPPASKRAQLRRLYFDLIGLPPTPQSMKRYLESTSENSYRDQVEKLLADSRYGERWARHWLDVVRYADTRGGGLEYPRPHMWRYRDYVVRSFNQDKPYDRFVKEQLAGDAYPAYGDEAKLALGFLALGVRIERSREEARRDVLVDVVDTTGATFLGVTLECARCHDHKYDPLLHKDYYRLEAFFAPININPQPLPFTDYEAPNEQPQWWERKANAWSEILAKRKTAGEQFKTTLKKREDPHYVLMAPQDIKDWVVPDLKRISFPKETLYNQGERERLKLIGRQTARFVNPNSPDYYKAKAHIVSDSPLSHTVSTHLLKGGNHKLRGEEIKPGFLTAISDATESVDLEGLVGSPRKLLAEWIASPKNPLTARVMVNRIWQHHFGRGLVRTASDFGNNGSGTIHQDLIDWLAWQFVESGWSVKDLHRLILYSDVYRQSVENPENTEYEKIDSSNLYLWKRSPIRLQAEVIRDSLLAVSGQLNPIMGGPPYLPAAEDEWQKRSRTWWEPSPQEDRNRRTIYMLQMRSFQLPMITVFDGPNTSDRCAVRDVTSVTSQVFSLFNGKFVHQQSQHMAQRIIEEVGNQPHQQVRRAFQLAIQRDPIDSEMTASLDFLRPGTTTQPETQLTSISLKSTRSREETGQQQTPEAVLKNLCLTLLNMNEFIYLE